MSLLSVIVPCYNEEESVALFYRELTKNDPFFKEKEIELELLYIDDGSKDGTVREVKKLRIRACILFPSPGISERKPPCSPDWKSLGETMWS